MALAFHVGRWFTGEAQERVRTLGAGLHILPGKDRLSAVEALLLSVAASTYSLVPSSMFQVPEERTGGAEGDRTPDLHTASVALSQLSYSPNVEQC